MATPLTAALGTENVRKRKLRGMPLNTAESQKTAVPRPKGTDNKLKGNLKMAGNTPGLSGIAKTRAAGQQKVGGGHSPAWYGKPVAPGNLPPVGATARHIGRDIIRPLWDSLTSGLHQQNFGPAVPPKPEPSPDHSYKGVPANVPPLSTPQGQRWLKAPTMYTTTAPVPPAPEDAGQPTLISQALGQPQRPVQPTLQQVAAPIPPTIQTVTAPHVPPAPQEQQQVPPVQQSAQQPAQSEDTRARVQQMVDESIRQGQQDYYDNLHREAMAKVPGTTEYVRGFSPRERQIAEQGLAASYGPVGQALRGQRLQGLSRPAGEPSMSPAQQESLNKWLNMTRGYRQARGFSGSASQQEGIIPAGGNAPARMPLSTAKEYEDTGVPVSEQRFRRAWNDDIIKAAERKGVTPKELLAQATYKPTMTQREIWDNIAKRREARAQGNPLIGTKPIAERRAAIQEREAAKMWDRNARLSQRNMASTPLQRLMNQSSPEEARRFAEEMTRARTRGAVDPNVIMRSAAITALGNTTDPAARKALMDIIRQTGGAQGSATRGFSPRLGPSARPEERAAAVKSPEYAAGLETLGLKPGARASDVYNAIEDRLVSTDPEKQLSDEDMQQLQYMANAMPPEAYSSWSSSSRGVMDAIKNGDWDTARKLAKQRDRSQLLPGWMPFAGVGGALSSLDDAASVARRLGLPVPSWLHTPAWLRRRRRHIW